ncbi:MAG: tetratricopeptide repeat protein, partial [Bacteroidota bacterium]
MHTLLNILLACCLGFTTLVAQQINLTGRVSIHNSKYRTGQIDYVEGTVVSAPYAGETNSDNEGKWRLTFQGIPGGTVIKLGVEKAGYEVVNSYDLERVVLGQKPRLPIYITTKGRLAQAQTELYNISKKALYARKDAIIARLQGEKAESETALAELAADWGVEISSVGEAMTLLDSKIEELEQRLPKFAQELAAKNLDFASDLYIKAYELYQAGDIERAIAMLDDAKLEQSYQEALATIEEGKNLANIAEDLQEKGRLQIDQILESYQLKAEGHNVLFEYRKAATAQRKIVEILATSSAEETLELADAYGALGNTLQDLGDYTKALNAKLRSTQIKEKLLSSDDEDLATSYNNLAGIYQDLGDYE